MAPTKVTSVKKPPKALPPIEKTISKKNKLKQKKKNFQNFSRYIYKVLVNVTQGKTGITRKSMMIMNNFVFDMMEKIASEAGKLTSHSKKNTLSSHEIQSALKLLIPGELARHANMEALKAVTTFHNNRNT